MDQQTLWARLPKSRHIAPFSETITRCKSTLTPACATTSTCATSSSSVALLGWRSITANYSTVWTIVATFLWSKMNPKSSLSDCFILNMMRVESLSKIGRWWLIASLIANLTCGALKLLTIAIGTQVETYEATRKSVVPVQLQQGYCYWMLNERLTVIYYITICFVFGPR